MNSGELDAKKVEEIMPLLGEINKVQRDTRLLRLLFFLLAILVIVAWLLSILNHFRKFDMEKFGDEIAQRAEKSWPYISEELNKLVNSIIPVVENSLEKELEAAAPEITEKFNSEAKLLESNIKKEIEDSMKRFLTSDSRVGALSELKAAFPSLAEGEGGDKLLAALQESFLLSAQKQLSLMFADYYETILKFEGAFKKIKADLPA
ncbi:MAG: hypothetical protein FJ088_03240, partial [Deltaproteobacteria bacterium]|nr:hypothetical protein [Deltaproteobacteria bacterium]